MNESKENKEVYHENSKEYNNKKQRQAEEI
jgi:hypothetical protein